MYKEELCKVRGVTLDRLDEMKLVGDDVVGECCPHEWGDGLVSSSNKVEAVLMYQQMKGGNT